MRLFGALCAVALMCTAAAPAFAVNTPTADDKLQAACYPDVDKFCKDAVPDEDKVAACMKQHRAEISEKCKEAYKASGRKD